MTWTKLSDDFSDESWDLSDAAYRLQVEGLNYANRKLLDGRLPKDDLRRFAKRPEAAAELVRGGWWVDAGSHYIVRFHLEHQPTRDEVLARRAVSQANGRKGGRARRPGRSSAPQTDVRTEPGSQDETHRDGT